MSKELEKDNDDIFEITFQNAVSQQTYVFQKKDLQGKGFLGGLVAHPLKENQAGKATVRFEGANHPISFPLEKKLFQNLEQTFQKNMVMIDSDDYSLILSGQEIYQLDKLLDYFACLDYKKQILEDCQYFLSCPADDHYKPDNFPYFVLILEDNQIDTIDELINWYMKITKANDLEPWLKFHHQLLDLANQNPAYDFHYVIRILHILNSIRYHLSGSLLEDQRLSQELLINPWDLEPYLKYQPRENLYFSDLKPSCQVGDPVLVSRDEAILRFKMMTQGLLEKMPWENVVICGGAVNIMLDATLQPGNFMASDIDIFIYGKNAQERLDAVVRLLAYFQQLPGRKFFALKQSVIGIFIVGYPVVFQIIVGNTGSILDILHYFDLDHLRMAYQDGQFYLTIEAIEALRTKSSYLNAYGTNQKRIWKTVHRGYNLVNQDICFRENCFRFLTDVEMAKHHPPGKEPQPDLSMNLSELVRKYGVFQYQYYHPRPDMPDEKVKCDIHLYYGYKVDRISSLSEEILPNITFEGDFKSHFGNKYMELMPNFNSYKLNFKDGVSNYRIFYGTDKICLKSPTCWFHGHEGPWFDDQSGMKNWVVRTDNQYFLRYIQFISEKILKRLKRRYATNNTSSILADDNSGQYRDRVNLDERSLTVKLDYLYVNFFLSNGRRLDDTQTKNLLKYNTSKGGPLEPRTRFKLDIILDKLYYRLINRERKALFHCFVYQVKNVYFLDAIDPLVYTHADSSEDD